MVPVQFYIKGRVQYGGTTVILKINARGRFEAMKTRESIGLYLILLIVLVAGIAVGVGLTASLGRVPVVQGAQPTAAQQQAAEPNQFLISTQESFRGIVQAVSPAVCTVKVITRVQGTPYQFPSFGGDMFEWFFGPQGPQGPQQGPQQQQPQPQEREVPASGSGFLVSPDGYLLTNNHVVQNADEIKVTMNGHDEYDAKIVGQDPDSDVAVLKIEGDKPFPYIEMGDSDAMQTGDWVIAIGNPFGYLDQTVTVGVISAKNREQITGTQYENFLQTDAAINFGNSGGPLVNIYGKVIGINTAITAQGSGIGFAVPINMAKLVYKDFLDFGEVRRAWVGISIKNPTEDEVKRLNLDTDQGALITEVGKDDPGSKAGLKKDDFIIKVAGNRTYSSSQVSRLIAEQTIGEPFEVTIIRDGKEMTMSITPAKRSSTPIIQGGTNTVSIQELGFTIRDIDSTLREQANIPDAVEGVIIAQVDRNSAASRKGLQPGVVITGIEDQKVTSVEDFVNKFDSYKNQNTVVLDVLYIRSDGTTDADVIALKLK